jgi:hypothetical protein
MLKEQISSPVKLLVRAARRAKGAFAMVKLTLKGESHSLVPDNSNTKLSNG